MEKNECDKSGKRAMEKDDCDKSGKRARVGPWRQTIGNHEIDQRLQSTKLAMDKAVIGHGDSDSDKTRDKVCQDKSAEGKKDVLPKIKSQEETHKGYAREEDSESEAEVVKPTQTDV